MVFPDTEPVFLAFLPESRSTEMSVPKDEKTEESTFFASSRTFSLSLSHADSVQNLMAQARHLALFDFPILIQGESGTQRRTLARAIHNFSRRHHYPFSVLHSPGNDLTEASLLRLLAETNHGTLVLSQVDRFPLSIQDLLVNVLTNVHGNFFSAPETRRFDVRIIAIADDNLYKKVEKGTFLRELFSPFKCFRASDSPDPQTQGGYSRSSQLLSASVFPQHRYDLRPDLFGRASALSEGICVPRKYS